MEGSLFLAFATTTNTHSETRRPVARHVANRLRVLQAEVLDLANESFARARTSSIGTFVSTRCWYRSIASILSRLSESFSDFLDVLRAAVEATLLSRAIDFETELRCDDDLFRDRRERFADNHSIRVRAVHFRGVEERHTAIDGGSNELDGLVLVRRRSVA